MSRRLGALIAVVALASGALLVSAVFWYRSIGLAISIDDGPGRRLARGPLLDRSDDRRRRLSPSECPAAASWTSASRPWSPP